MRKCWREVCATAWPARRRTNVGPLIGLRVFLLLDGPARMMFMQGDKCDQSFAQLHRMSLPTLEALLK